MLLVQLVVVQLHFAEVVFGLLELGLPHLDLLVLPGHLQQGLHLVGTGQGSEVNLRDVPIPASTLIRVDFIFIFLPHLKSVYGFTIYCFYCNRNVS